MMSADILKKAPAALNVGLVTPSLDSIVPEEAHTVLAVGEQTCMPAVEEVPSESRIHYRAW